MLGIIAEILEIAKWGVAKAKIMYEANLSFIQFNTYLSFLLDRGFLGPVASSSSAYITSGKGIQFLRINRELVKLLRYKEHPTAINSLRLIRNGSRITVSW